MHDDSTRTPARQFAQARALLLKHHGDPEAARAAFRWPQLDAFNWVDDWFDDFGAGNHTPALTVVREGEPAIVLSWQELSERSRRLARYFEDQGVQRGDRMLVMLGNVPALWETLLAAIRLGAVVIPATAQLTPLDVEDRVQRGEARHIVTDAAGAEKLLEPQRLGVRLALGGAPHFTDYAAALSAPARFERKPTRASDPLLLYFTSGTTARPKLVLHTHGSYPVGHLSTMFWLGLREGDRHQNISSPGWAKHAWSSFFAPWNAGASIVVHDQPRFSAQRAIELLREQSVNSLCAPPTVWRMLILAQLAERPSALRELASAGEPLNPEVIDTIERAWGITIRDGYGQSETTAMVGNPPGQVVKPGSMGKPLPGYEVVLLDAQGQPSQDGEVAITLGAQRPTGLMYGYLDDPARTDAATAGGYYRTGDEASCDADGYVHFVGRHDDVFKSSDYRISPFELESVLLEHESVAEAAVVPSPDPLRLAVPKAFVTLRPGVEPSAQLARDILAFCKQRLAPYKRVRRLEFATLPKTLSGKIRRVELRRREQARADTEREFTLD